MEFLGYVFIKLHDFVQFRELTRESKTRDENFRDKTRKMPRTRHFYVYCHYCLFFYYCSIPIKFFLSGAYHATATFNPHRYASCEHQTGCKRPVATESEILG